MGVGQQETPEKWRIGKQLVDVLSILEWPPWIRSCAEITKLSSPALITYWKIIKKKSSRCCWLAILFAFSMWPGTSLRYFPQKSVQTLSCRSLQASLRPCNTFGPDGLTDGESTEAGGQCFRVKRMVGICYFSFFLLKQLWCYFLKKVVWYCRWGFHMIRVLFVVFLCDFLKLLWHRDIPSTVLGSDCVTDWNPEMSDFHIWYTMVYLHRFEIPNYIKIYGIDDSEVTWFEDLWVSFVHRALPRTRSFNLCHGLIAREKEYLVPIVFVWLF